MNRQYSHGNLPPGASRFKRKEREPFFPPKSSPPPSQPRATVAAATTTSTSPVSSNQLLAGYLAHEFLTKGTLLGQKFDPARAEAVPVAAAAKGKSKSASAAAVAEAEAEPRKLVKNLKQNESYNEITSLLMMNNEGRGVHIPGIVNPAQLARWIQM